jgi:hypothetical protein
VETISYTTITEKILANDVRESMFEILLNMGCYLFSLLNTQELLNVNVTIFTKQDISHILAKVLLKDEHVGNYYRALLAVVSLGSLWHFDIHC